MSQAGYTPIQLYRSTTPGAIPDAANLLPGELALNITDTEMAVYTENASGVVKRVFNNPAGLTYPTADGTAGQTLVTNGAGVLAFATAASLAVVVVSGTTQAAVANTQYVLTNVAAATVTLPASPTSGDTVWVTPTNGLLTNVIARNGQTIMGLAENLTMDSANATVNLRFVNSSWRLV